MFQAFFILNSYYVNIYYFEYNYYVNNILSTIIHILFSKICFESSNYMDWHYLLYKYYLPVIPYTEDESLLLIQILLRFFITEWFCKNTIIFKSNNMHNIWWTYLFMYSTYFSIMISINESHTISLGGKKPCSRSRKWLSCIYWQIEINI